MKSNCFNTGAADYWWHASGIWNVWFYAVPLESHGRMVVKLDMSKAYDKVEWRFLKIIMLELDFRQGWIDLVMHCVETTTFSFFISGERKGFVKLSRGMWQEDPIFSYLFLSCAKALSYHLITAFRMGHIVGHQVCPSMPLVSHLLCADNSIVFCKANSKQVERGKNMLLLYEQASWQQVDYNKSNICF